MSRLQRLKPLSLIMLLFLVGCVGIPDGVTPVNNFSLERYLGQWYEIARLDHSFERGLSQVSAQYSMRQDGGVRVLNRGYSTADEAWEEAEGKAYFVQEPDLGYLKVSFFGPFYGSYIIFELDHEGYQYSLVSGPDKSYLWLLSRTPSISAELQVSLLEKARDLGFDTSQLIFVEHS